MDGDIGGIERRNLFQGSAKAIIGIGGQTGDQIHVDGAEAGSFCLFVPAEDVLAGVGTATGPQHRVCHRLGIDAHPVCAVVADGLQLLGA